jgi:hypothetical protein
VKFLANLQGYRTVILNAAVLGTAIFGRDTLPVSPEELDTILVGIAAVGNVVMRVYTTTPIGHRATP